jgi:hypothetical protein
MFKVRSKETCANASSVPLEVLHGALVLLCRGAGLEGAEVAAATSLRIRLARVEAIFAGLEFADH